jgi:hypothetical protein
MNRVKKMVWVEEGQEQTGEGRRLKAVEKELKSAPLTPLLEKQVLILNAAIQDTVNDTTLPPKIKALILQRKVNKYLYYLARMEAEKQKILQTVKETHVPVHESTMVPTANEVIPTTTVPTTPVLQDVRVDTGTVLKYGKETQPFSKESMQNSLHLNIRPRFSKVLDELETKSGFKWDPESGEITMNKQLYPGTDIKELVLHKVRTDMKESTHDPPPTYKRFEQFLKRRGISSNTELRKKGPAVPVRQLSGKVLKRDRTQAKLQRKQTAGSGIRFLNY